MESLYVIFISSCICILSRSILEAINAAVLQRSCIETHFEHHQ
jgi:hypothetical protein